MISANVSLPYIFSDNMVIQRNKTIEIWGKADAGEKVTVAFRNQKNYTTTDNSGNWKISLKPEKEGGPFEMKISGKNEIVFRNILIGDVWLCSGQSNMEWVLKNTEGYENEVSQKTFPEIRHIKIPKNMSAFPQDNTLETNWNIADSETIGEFSAVAYFFAKKMYEETGIPVGLINSTWGGTVVETWISRNAFLQNDYFRETVSKMPQIDIEELKAENQKLLIKNIEKLQNSKFAEFNADDFLKNDFDDSKLGNLYQPKSWENQGLNSLDGIVWIRKTIELSEEDLQSDAKMYLGKIDDQDFTYFNGNLVGSINQYDKERMYVIPKNLLKKGKNIITIKIVDNGGGGGLWSEDKDVKMETFSKTISLAGNWKFAVEKVFSGINPNDFPSMLYNAMIHPVENYKTCGILWYQGESNESRACEYNKSFPLLIESWRNLMGKNLPFYFVQLATFTTSGNNSNEGSAWAELREAQTNALHLKNTGMVVTTDIGNPKDIHPRNKKTVGERLANLALKNGKISPVFQNSKVEGNKIVVSFSPSEKLVSENNEKLRGFEIAGKDHIFYPADAEISGNTVKIFSEKVPEPVAARYGWKGDDSEINLFTEKRLPVSPFRTDDFKEVTRDVKYQLNF